MKINTSVYEQLLVLMYLLLGASYAASYTYISGQKIKTLLNKIVHISLLSFACCKDELEQLCMALGKDRRKPWC